MTRALGLGAASATLLLVLAPSFAAAAGPAAGSGGPGWSATPDPARPGGTVRLASGDATPCVWSIPMTPAGSELRTVDGTRVDVTLIDGGAPAPLASLAVQPGGAWSGPVTIPPSTAVGDVTLTATCVIDDPSLDGVRSFPFSSLVLSVTSADTTSTTGSDPSTTTTAPTTSTTAVANVGPPPLVVTNPVEVLGTQEVRPGATPATGAPTARVSTPATAPPATLPFTGSGTLGIILAGAGSLVIGAAAIAYGARNPRQAGN